MSQQQQQQQLQEMQQAYQAQFDQLHQQHAQQVSDLMAQINEMKQQIQQQQQQQQSAPQVKEAEEVKDPKVDSDISRGIMRSEYGKASVLAATHKFSGDSTTFPLWSKTMKTILSNVGLSDLLTQEIPVPIKDSSNQLKIDNTMMILLGGLSSNIALKYTSAALPKHVWDSLQSEYNRITETTQSVARKEFATCKQRPEERVKDFTQRLQTCQVRLECMDVPVSSSEFKHQLYEGLAEEYASCISQLKLQGISDINKIIQHVHDHGVMLEARQRAHDSEVVYQVRQQTAGDKNIQLQHKNGRGCFTCNSPTHLVYYCPQNKNKRKCEYCHKIGHTLDECYYYEHDHE